MPTITAIKPQKSKKRVNVHLDGKFGFGLDLENFLKLGLKVEQELSEGEVEQIVKKGEFQKTYDKLLRFSTLRPRSLKEINDWLKKKSIHESLHSDLLAKLKHLELIDDEKFALWWVEQRINFRPKGKKALNFELRSKGVDREIIQKVLEKTLINEEKTARELLENKSYKWKNLPRLEARQKKARFLAAKGFSWETIRQVID